ncbi:MAG: hypothetical protein JST91_18380 [Actinobacteria bacterium]|nr:hypothetical protein [Actinomycetota bacterium]
MRTAVLQEPQSAFSAEPGLADPPSRPRDDTPTGPRRPARRSRRLPEWTVLLVIFAFLVAVACVAPLVLSYTTGTAPTGCDRIATAGQSIDRTPAGVPLTHRAALAMPLCCTSCR